MKFDPLRGLTMPEKLLNREVKAAYQRGRRLVVPLMGFPGLSITGGNIKLAQQNYVNEDETALFSAILFLNAFISGALIAIFYRKYNHYFLQVRTWGWGFLLGSVNFGSIYFLVRALHYSSPSGKHMDSSVIFGANNISIVALSVLVGLMIFREKLRPVNWAGIVLSALALLLFTLV